MVKVGLYGASGKMGREIIACLKHTSNAKLSVAYALDEIECELPKDVIITDKLDELFINSDVVIDFSIAVATHTLITHARANPKPLVIGTTALTEETTTLIQQASNAMPILVASNMSLGVAVLNKVAKMVSQKLRDFDIEILEMHHRHKQDAPSGTALTLAQSVAQARDLDLKNVMVNARDELSQKRGNDEISVLSMRGGDVVGRHTVGFYNDGEFIELTHNATSRATFANGAIKAAVWLSNQPNGLYGIDDCLGI